MTPPNWEDTFQDGQTFEPKVIDRLKQLGSSGVQSVSAADSSITIGGTASDPTIAVAGGGGGSLPAWWTIDNTAPSVLFDDLDGDQIALIYRDSVAQKRGLDMKATFTENVRFRLIENDGTVFADWTDRELRMYGNGAPSEFFMFNDIPGSGQQTVVLSGGNPGEPGIANLGQLSVGQTGPDLADRTALVAYGFSGAGNIVDIQDSNFVSQFRIGPTGNLGFFGASPAAKPTGVAVTAAGIHAALVSLNLIAA